METKTKTMKGNSMTETETKWTVLDGGWVGDGKVTWDERKRAWAADNGRASLRVRVAPDGGYSLWVRDDGAHKCLSGEWWVVVEGKQLWVGRRFATQQLALIYQACESADGRGEVEKIGERELWVY